MTTKSEESVVQRLGVVIMRYLVRPCEMIWRAGALGYLLVVIWFLYPFAVQSIVHPTDVAGLQLYIQDLPIKGYISVKAMVAGEITAVCFLAVLALGNFVLLLFIYRELQCAFSAWVLALVLVGGLGNLAWGIYFGFFDIIGIVAGVFPTVVMVVQQYLFEHLSQDFVFGKGVRPNRT